MFLDTLCNMTLDCNNFTQPYHNETFRLVLGFGLGISSLMSIIENAIVCVVLLKYRILRTPSNAILLSLATGTIIIIIIKIKDFHDDIDYRWYRFESENWYKALQSYSCVFSTLRSVKFVIHSTIFVQTDFFLIFSVVLKMKLFAVVHQGNVSQYVSVN